MKKILLVAATALFAFSSHAGNNFKTTSWTTNISDDADIPAMIAKINSGRISVPSCNGKQEVYAYSIREGGNSYVKTADGGFRPIGTRVSFSIKCYE